MVGAGQVEIYLFRHFEREPAQPSSSEHNREAGSRISDLDE